MPPLPEELPEKKDFYQKLRKKIRRWMDEKGQDHRFAEFLMVAPDLFHLLVKLSLDPNVPKNQKTKIAIAIAYFISPIDVVPEAILGPAGYVDDVALAAYVLNSVVKNTDPDIIKDHWAGEEDILKLLEKILGMADDMIGSGLWRKIKSRVGQG